MLYSKRFLLAAVLALGLGTGLPVSPAQAGSNDPLFINLTSDDGHRVNMALTFGASQHQRGHALTLFLNDRAVLAASKANAGTFSEQQKALSELVAKGANVIVCPMCMKHFGVNEADLLPGFVIGNPERTGAALFQDNTKVLTW